MIVESGIGVNRISYSLSNTSAFYQVFKNNSQPSIKDTPKEDRPPNKPDILVYSGTLLL